MGKRKNAVSLVLVVLFAAYASAQTTNGLFTGVITDPSGAVVPGVQVRVVNETTSEVRVATSGENGTYIIPQLPPGIYDASVAKQGFATVNRLHIQLLVNQSVQLDFKLQVSATAETIQVTGAPPPLDTTSATLSNVIEHQTTVDLPLNGREFTQLTLLTPGAAPVEDSQQGLFTVALGSGGISPSVAGQRGEQDNYTMDGVMNNEIFTNIWAISPPPDAIEEFNVQSHITDAQFSITSGANINVVTRSGTKDFHGDLWEFLRNDVLDAQTFPDTRRLPYRQNQYGFYLGGPVLLPHFNGRNNTWFSAYWEGFRYALSQTELANTLTTAMSQGDFSAVLGKQVGTDTLGNPEYANEIYDPTTSTPDPAHPKEYLRTAFSYDGKLNVIPPGDINPASALVIKKYYPAPNLPVAAGVLPNYSFTGVTTTASDNMGLRIDHRFSNNDMLFGRYNRFNANRFSPEALPGYSNILNNYAQEYEVGYTHIFGPNTILNFHYGYTDTSANPYDQPAGTAFANSVNFTQAVPARLGIQMGPGISLSNGYSGVSQVASPIGPNEGHDYTLDLSRVQGRHTLGFGGMYYHIFDYSDGWKGPTTFTQNGTAQDGTAGPTGFGPASFLLGVVDDYAPWAGDSAANQTINWFGGYAQDLWKATKNLSLTFGLRYDIVYPPNFHKIISALDELTGQFIVTAPVPSAGYPKATGPSGYFYTQYNGFEPRFGIAYQPRNRTVLHGAFAVLDDHNNTVVQENEVSRVSWPSAVAVNLASLDLGLPKMYLNKLPTHSELLTPTVPYNGPGANPHNKIPYTMEFNAGIQQQLSTSMNLKIDYVGSLARIIREG